MNLYQRISLMFLLIGLGLADTQAQVRIELTDSNFMLPELGVILEEAGEEVSVIRKLPFPAPASAEVDGPALKTGDVLAYFNGKRIRSVARLSELYDGLDKSEAIQIGVRRGQETLITSFKKTGMEALNGPGRRVMTFEEEGQGPMLDDITPIPAMGVVVGRQNRNIEVAMVISDQAGTPGAHFKQGDVLTQLNGQSVSSIDALQKAISKLETGASINVALKRGGSTVEVSFPNPDPDTLPRLRIETDSDGGEDVDVVH